MSDQPTALLATPEVVEQAIEAVTDPTLPIEARGAMYAGLRRLRLRIDRVLRPVTQELEMAMVAAGAETWGPLQLRWRAVDVRYPVNDPGNWADATVQELLEGWHADAGSRPFIREVPRHFEVDTAALGEALHAGDPGARALYADLKRLRLRTEEGRSASLSVREEAA